MAKFMIEIVGKHGASHLEGKKTLVESRKYACKLIGKSGDTVNVFQIVDGYVQKQVARVWFDDMKAYAGQYVSFRPGYYCQTYTGNRGRYRLSPKTGELLDVSREWKYI